MQFIYWALVALMHLIVSSAENGTFFDRQQLNSNLGDDASLPCHFNLSGSDQVTLILFYRNASHVGQVGAPLYTLDARTVGDNVTNAQHFVSIEHQARIRLQWPPTRLNSKANKRRFISSLSIRNVSLSDAGEYLCRIDFRWGRTVVNYIQLDVIVPPRNVIILDGASQIVHDWSAQYFEDSFSRFVCEAEEGRPKANIEWLTNEQPINASWFNQLRLANDVLRSELQLKLIRDYLNSSLTCRVFNIHHSLSVTIRLDLILRPQRITLRPTFVPLIKGNSVDFIVQTQGAFPPADLYCAIRNLTLSGDVRKTLSGKYHSTSSAMIKYIPRIQDHGEDLVCRASNNPAWPQGQSEIKYRLNITYKPSLKLRNDLGNLHKLVERSALILKCELNSNPEVNDIIWYKDNQPFSQFNITTDMLINKNTLSTGNLDRKDGGHYKCAARNAIGYSESNELFVNVLYAPECRPQQKMLYGIELGQWVQIQCELAANPSTGLTFHWRSHSPDGRHSMELASIMSSGIGTSGQRSPRTASTNNAIEAVPIGEQAQLFVASNHSASTLQYKITKLNQLGAISCWASNSVGVQKEHCMFSLMPLASPDPLVNCSVSSPMVGFFIVDCTPGADGGLPQRFHCEVYQLPFSAVVPNKSNQNEARLLANLTELAYPTFVLSMALHNNTLYQPGMGLSLRLYASNAKGLSNAVNIATAAAPSIPFQAKNMSEKGHVEETGNSSLWPAGSAASLLFSTNVHFWSMVLAALLGSIALWALFTVLLLCTIAILRKRKMQEERNHSKALQRVVHLHKSTPDLFDRTYSNTRMNSLPHNLSTHGKFHIAMISPHLPPKF